MDFTGQTLSSEQLREAESNWGDGGSITFQAAPSNKPGAPEPARIELRSDGDILVNGRLAENDKEVVEALRRFLREAR